MNKFKELLEADRGLVKAIAKEINSYGGPGNDQLEKYITNKVNKELAEAMKIYKKTSDAEYEARRSEEDNGTGDNAEYDYFMNDFQLEVKDITIGRADD